MVKNNTTLESKLVIEGIEQHIKDTNISCTSMIVTIFGDTISQHGHWVWLTSLIKALEPFGFNERQVRTSVYRLVQSEWLKVKKVGRCSYYCFTELAVGHYEKAAKRIYLSERAEWDQQWLLVLTTNVNEENKEALRKSLLWQGFNSLSSNLYAHPSNDRESLDQALYELGIVNEVVVMNASTGDIHSRGAMKNLIQSRWQLSELESAYQGFLDFYRPWCQHVEKKQPNAFSCFILRCALVHDFRRILLRDPDFPNEMLPTGWAGNEAHDLVKRFYSLLINPSLDFIENHFKNAQGNVPEASKKFYQRFGGIR